MPVQDYSLVPDENTDINGIDIGEGCAPRNINDAIRQAMADTKGFYDTVNASLGDISAALDAINGEVV